MSGGELEDIEFRTEDEYITGLRAELENSFREFDKLILTVSSGILALSVAFFGKGEGAHHHAGYLMVSWGALLLAILLVAVSLLVEQAHKKHLIFNDGHSDKKERRLFKAIGLLNLSSGITFLLGVVFLVLYLWINVKGAN